MSLYPKVPTSTEEQRKVAMRIAAHCGGNDPSELISVNSLVDLLGWCLRHHYVRAPDGAVLRQVAGLGTGIHFAPGYANIWLAIHEEPFVRAACAAGHLALFKRFIDDLIGVWLGSCAELDSFLQQLNSFHTNIKLDGMQFGTLGGDPVNFMDMRLRLAAVSPQPAAAPGGAGAARVMSETYQKPFNSFQYLPPNTCRPRQAALGWLEGEAKRLVRTNTEAASYTAHLAQFKERLMARGFDAPAVEEKTGSVSHAQRAALLDVTRKPQPEGDPILDAHRRPALAQAAGGSA